MKRKKTQKHALKIQKKKATNSLRKKVNKQNRKIKKRAKAAKVVKSKKHNRRFSDHAPLNLSSAMLEASEAMTSPLAVPFDFGNSVKKANLDILRLEAETASRNLSFAFNMLLTEMNLDILEKKLESNQEELGKLANIKIGQD